MLCYKLNNLSVHHCHTAMNLYEINKSLVTITYSFVENHVEGRQNANAKEENNQCEFHEGVNMVLNMRT